jgi:hypothetical protein
MKHNININSLKMPIKKTITYGLTKKVALFANARDESHIKEWAAHHLLIGFDNIIIFDHKSLQPLKEVFKNFDNRVIIIRNNADGAIKMPLMNSAIEIAKKINVDWFIYLDADEFIILHDKFKGIKQLLNIYNRADSLAVNWLMFGSNHLVNDPDNMLEMYTKSELLLNDHVKCFVRPNEAINADMPHYYNIKNPNRMYGLNGRIPPGPFNKLQIPFYKSPMYIAHYVYQSEESYTKRKINLPRDDTGELRGGDAKTIHNSYNDIDNLQVKMKYSQNIKKFLESRK